MCVGLNDGRKLGLAVETVGYWVDTGTHVGRSLGSCDGFSEGSNEGLSEGSKDGCSVGSRDTANGVDEGCSVEAGT